MNKNFYNIEEFNFLNDIRDNHNEFNNEFLNNDSSIFKKYFYLRNDSEGTAKFESNKNDTIPWVSIPIFDNSDELSNTTKKIYPLTFKSIISVAKNYKVYTANFCILSRQSYFPRHKHDKDGFCIFHVLLNDLDNFCLYEADNEYKSIKTPGDYVIFELSKMHSVYNFSNTSKFSLSISFKL